MFKLVRPVVIFVLAAYASLSLAQNAQIYTFPSGATFEIPAGGRIRPDSNPPEVLIGRNFSIEVVDPDFIGVTPQATIDAPLEQVLIYLLGVVGYDEPLVEENQYEVVLDDGRLGVAYNFINSSNFHQTMMSIRLSDRRVGVLNVRSRNELTRLQRTIVLGLANTFDAGPGLAPDLFAQGQVAYDAGDYTAAAELFSAVVLLDENAQQAHYLRAQSFIAIGQLDLALASYQRAYDLAPDDASILSDIAGAYMLMGDMSSAVAALESRVDAEGEKNVPLEVLDTIDLYRQIEGGAVITDFHTSRALRLGEIGLYESALADLQIVIDSGAENAALHAARGDMLQKMERYADAVAAYTDAIRIERLPMLFYQRGAAHQAGAAGNTDNLSDAAHDYQCLVLLADDTISNEQLKAAQRAIETVVVSLSGYRPINDAALCVP